MSWIGPALFLCRGRCHKPFWICSSMLSNTEVTIILFLLLKAGQSFYSSSSGTFEYPVRVTEDGRCGWYELLQPVTAYCSSYWPGYRSRIAPTLQKPCTPWPRSRPERPELWSLIPGGTRARTHTHARMHAHTHTHCFSLTWRWTRAGLSSVFQTH